MIKTYQKNIGVSRLRRDQAKITLSYLWQSIVERKILVFSLLFLLVTLPIFLLVTKYKSNVEAAWMDDSWGFRKAISIPSHTTLETNVYVTVPTFDATDTSKFQADCGDLRFTKQNGEQLPYFVVDCDATANIHVQFDSLPAGASTYYMYYGNPSVANGFSSADFSTAATGLGTQTLASEEKSAGPVAYWKFDEGYGATANNSTSTTGINGTISGATWQSEDQCISGKCLYFTSTNNISIADPTNGSLDFGTGDFTISTWIRTGTSADNRNLIRKGAGAGLSGWRFGLSSGIPNILIGDTTTYTEGNLGNTSIAGNKWHHYVVVFNRSGNAVAYIDGKQVGTRTISTVNLSVDNSSAVTIGNSYATFTGFLDDIKIYPYARTAAQIKSDFASKGSGSVKGTAASLGSSAKNSDAFSNGLVAYWKSDEASGNGADSSGNSNTTTVSGSNNYGVGKFGNGFRTGVSSTNLEQNPSLETNLTGWGYWNNSGTATVTQSNEQAKFGSYSYKQAVTSDGNQGVYSYGAANVVEGNTYTMSFWVNVTAVGAGESIPFYYRVWHSTGNYIINTIATITATTNGWVRYSTTQTIPNNGYTGNSLRLSFYTNKTSTVVYVDGVQTEQTSSVTPYLDGSLGTGYSWSGTAHASTSIRTASTSTNATLLNNMTGSLSFWFNSPSLDTSTQCPLGSGDGDNTGGLFFGLKSTGVYLTHNYATSQNVTPQYVATIANNTWNHVVYTWDNVTLKGNLYVNGTLQQNVSYSQAITIGEYIQNLGTCTRTGSTTFNGLLDDVRDYNRALSGAEVSKLYAFAPGPIAYYNFDEGAGNANDVSGNGYTGVSTGTTAVSGKYGKARRFNGSSDVINVTDNANLRFGTGNFTVESWIKFPLSGSLAWEGVVSKGYTTSAPANTWGLIRNSTLTNSVKFQDTIDAGGSWNANLGSSTFSDGWHHVAVTRSGTTYSIYSDGVFTSSGTYALANLSTTAVIKLGSDASNRFLNGSIDDTKIYNYARTSGQITEDMNAGHPLGGSPVGSQVGYWKFDEGYGTTAKDTLNNNHGTFNNSPQWNQSGKFNKAVQFSSVGNATNISLSGSGTLENVTDNSFTFSSWVNPTAIPPSGGTNYIGTIVGRPGYHTYLGYTYQQKFSLGVYNSSNSSFSATSTNTYNLNQWYYLTGVVNTTDLSIKLFVNGIQVASGNYTGTLKDYTTSAYRIGASANGACTADWTWCFDGLIDEVKIYNAALTADEVKLDYNRGSAMVLGDSVENRERVTSGQTLYLDATDKTSYPGSGTVWYDRSGNGYNATLSSPTWNGIKFTNTAATLTNLGSSVYPNIATNTTILWVYPEVGGGSVWQVTDMDAHTYMSYSGNGSAYINTWETGTYAQRTIWDATESVPHQIVITKNGSVRTVYDNLVQKGQVTITNIATSVNANLIYGATAQPMGLSIVETYNRVLSTDEITQDYYAHAYKFNINTGPVGEWNFEEGSGTVANDSSGNSNTGTITGATHTTGKIGKSLSLDGSGDYFTVSSLDNGNFPQNGTFSTWIKVNSSLTTDGVSIFDAYSGARNHIFARFCSTGNGACSGTSSGTRQIQVAFQAASGYKYSTITTFPTDTWTHVSIVWDTSNDNGKLYLNGILSNSGSISDASWIPDGQTVSFGSGTVGSIDSVKLYNYARTPAQIAWDYNRGRPVGHWKLDECTGSAANDSSGNSYTGTITIGASGSNTSAGACVGASGEAWNDGVTGKFNSSLDFDGTDDVVTVPLNIYGYTQITYSAWVKINGNPPTTQYSVITGNYGRSGIFINTNGMARARAFDSSDHYVASTSTVTDNDWHHITATYDQSSVLTKIYVDGKYENQMSFYPTILNLATSYIAENPNTIVDTFFNGQIDDVRIYNYALTPQQIKQVMNEGAGIRFGPSSGSP